MKAAVVHPGGRVDLVDVATPEPRPGEVVVRMLTAAICGSDLHRVFLGDLTQKEAGPPGHPGHEGTGRVVYSQSDRFHEGDLVLTVPDPAVGACFAEYQVLPEAFMVPVPGDLAPEVAVLAQQLGTVLFALKKFWPEGRGADVACVLGLGSAGQAFVAALKRMGFRTVVAADPVPFRCRVGQAMGADVAVGPDGVVAAVHDRSEGRGADLVVEASGRDAARQVVPELVARDGAIGFFGLPEGPHPIPLRFDMLFARRVRINFSVGAQHEPGLASFQEAVRWVAERPQFWAQLITHRLPLDRLEEGLALAEHPQGDILKVVLSC